MSALPNSAGHKRYPYPVPISLKLLNEGEEVVLDLHPHWEFFLRGMLALFAVIVVGVMVLVWLDKAPDVLNWSLGLAVLGCLAWFGWTYARWSTTHFVVTSDRLIYRHGVLAKRGIEIPLERINTIFFSQSIFERIVGSGNLVIESASETGRQHFYHVRRPSQIQHEIYRQMEANENRKFDRIGGGAPGASIPEQISQLDGLRQQGILSQEEFDQKKQDLLDKM